MKKIKPNWLDRTTCLIPLEYTLCINEKQFFDALKAFKAKGPGLVSFLRNAYSEATTHYIENEKGFHAAIVCVGDVKAKNPIEIYGLLIHEAVHVFQQACFLLGEESPSPEFEAYGIQSIALQLLYEYERLTSHDTPKPDCGQHPPVAGGEPVPGS